MMNENHWCSVCSSKMFRMFDYRMFTYFRCSNCKHVTTFPYPKQLQIEQHYKKGFDIGNYFIARKYNQSYLSNMKQFVQIVDKALQKQDKTIENSTVLDIGCYTGEFLQLLADAGADVYGIELQADASKIANKTLPGRIFNADIINEDIALPQSHFDIVTLLGVIEHVTDPVHLAIRAAEYLKPGGLLVIQTPCSTSLVARFMQKFWPPYTPIEHIHLFSEKSLYLLAKKLDFKKVVIKPHWKRHSLDYIYSMLKTFGIEFYRILNPFYKILPHCAKRFSIPFYIGEIIVLAVYEP